jgi:hypothetical protein
MLHCQAGMTWKPVTPHASLPGRYDLPRTAFRYVTPPEFCIRKFPHPAAATRPLNFPRKGHPKSGKVFIVEINKIELSGGPRKGSVEPAKVFGVDRIIL